MASRRVPGRHFCLDWGDDQRQPANHAARRRGRRQVWRAEHRLLARPAAVKLVRPEVLGGSTPGRRAERQARFEREAQATSSLRSPHTIE
jgi:hypothetical protein